MANDILGNLEDILKNSISGAGDLSSVIKKIMDLDADTEEQKAIKKTLNTTLIKSQKDINKAINSLKSIQDALKN